MEQPPKPIIAPEKASETQEGEVTYDLESGAHIRLQYKEFTPEKNENIEERFESTVIFLPGWEVGAHDPSTERIGMTFAASSKTEVFAITSASEKIGTFDEDGGASDMLYQEAIAISKFIQEKQFKDVTLVGYSIGGNKAIDIAHILQADPGLKINGLVLLASVGLYAQTPRELTGNLLKDSFVRTPKNLLEQDPQGFKKWFQVATDVGTHLAKNVVGGRGNIGKLRQGITEMARINPRIGEIKVPVVLISGSNDAVTDAEKLVPSEEDRATILSRAKYLNENLFTQSPYVRMLVPDKMGNHGLPYFRAESVANASLYLLERFHRSESDSHT